MQKSSEIKKIIGIFPAILPKTDDFRPNIERSLFSDMHPLYDARKQDSMEVCIRDMKKDKLMERVVKKLLEGVARVEVGSASCMMFYQPKAPEQLAEFKRRVKLTHK